KIGLALGVGTVRGFAHIGVLKALQEENIPVDYLAGSSMGAIVAGMYSAGVPVEELERIAKSFHVGKVANPSFKKSGLLDGEKIEKFLNKHIGHTSFDQLRIPLSVVCTDICTGDEIILADGSLKKALRASASFPGLFSPMHYAGRILVDGGLVNPVPASVVAGMGADIIIAVSVMRNVKQYIEYVLKKRNKHSFTQEHEKALSTANLIKLRKPSIVGLFRSLRKKTWTPNLVDILLQTVYIAEERIARSELLNVRVDILITPDFGDVAMFEFSKTDEIIARGKKETESKIPRLKELLEK
ncbi:MAG: patatin-like phospholipase family protein, partial [bacterium]|nr:patatin-like phospholipase family protein [bacterium]